MLHSTAHAHVAADPALAVATVVKNRAEAKAKTDGRPEDPGVEDGRQRRTLEQGITSASKAAHALARMSSQRGKGVFGTFDGVRALRDQLDKLDEILVAFGLADTSIIVIDDEDEEGAE